MAVHRPGAAQLRAEPVAPLREDLVEGGNHQQREQGRRDHAADDRLAERGAEVRALPRADGNRHHAGDEGEGRHQNGPQPDPSRLDDGLPARQAALLRPLREVHQQDRVLGDDAHQQDHADHAHDVDRRSRDQQRQHHADQRQGQREHDRERLEERAELHDEHEVHEQDGQAQRHEDLPEHFRLVLALASLLQHVARRQREVRIQPRVDVGEDLGERSDLRVGLDGDHAVAIEMVDAGRPEPRRDLRQLAIKLLAKEIAERGARREKKQGCPDRRGEGDQNAAEQPSEQEAAEDRQHRRGRKRECDGEHVEHEEGERRDQLVFVAQAHQRIAALRQIVEGQEPVPAHQIADDEAGQDDRDRKEAEPAAGRLPFARGRVHLVPCGGFSHCRHASHSRSQAVRRYAPAGMTTDCRQARVLAASSRKFHGASASEFFPEVFASGCQIDSQSRSHAARESRT